MIRMIRQKSDTDSQKKHWSTGSIVIEGEVAHVVVEDEHGSVELWKLRDCVWVDTIPKLVARTGSVVLPRGNMTVC